MKNMIKKSFICAFAALATLVASAFDTPYLTFRSAASFSLSGTKRWDGTLQKATSNPTDEASWSDWTGSSISAGLSDGQYYIYLRGKDNTTLNNSSYGALFSFSYGATSVYCEGDIEALRDYEGNPPAMAAGCCKYMFSGCSVLLSAPSLSATTLANECYFGMFKECSSLMTAPVLPAMTMATDCYRSMFEKCTSLKSLPSLPATTTALRCYMDMFSGCSGLEINTALPGVEWSIPAQVASLASNWNTRMFQGTSGFFTGTPQTETPYYVASALPFGEIYQNAGKANLDLALVGFSVNVDLSPTVKNGTAPYTFTHAGGTLPPGLYVSGSTLSGTPTAVGDYSFSLSVTDDESHTLASAAYTMQVVQPTVTATTFVGADGSPITTNCITLTTAMTTLNQAWYVASGTLNFGTGGIKISGDVNLVLVDSASMTVQGASNKAGINVAQGNSLTIYGQTESAGTLSAIGDGPDSDVGGAGIGGNDRENCGTITINGGTIVASAGGYAGGAGIGGGSYGNCGAITINRGTVTATGANYAAGIGGGRNGSGGAVTINGGTVTATAGSAGSGYNFAPNGIGQGYSGSSKGTLTVGPTMSVKAGSTANPTEEIGRGGSITIGTQRYFFVETAGLVQETSVFAAYANESKNWNLADTISGGTTPYSFTPVTGFEPPSGLTLSGTTLSGSVAAANTYTIKYMVTDSSATPLVLEAVYTLTVTAPDPITETQTALSATVGKSKSFTLADTISGGVPSYTFALASGSNAPDGFSLTDGVLSGTAASAVASYSFTVVVTDSLGTTKNVTYTFSAVESTGFTDDDPEEPASGDSVDCRTADGVVRSRTCTLLTSSSTVWNNSWYYVAPNTTLSIAGVRVNGKVSLILGDGATLTTQGASRKAGIYIEPGNTLSIYCQSATTGTLVALGGYGAAGIGGDNAYSTTTGEISNCGKVNIYGGIITATGNGDAAGIGGGDGYGNGGTISVYGGSVTATAGSGSAAGIGKGWGSSAVNGTLTVGEKILVKAGASANPTTVLDHGANGEITLSAQRYFTLETTGPTPLAQTVNAFAAYVDEAFEVALTNTVSGGTPSYTFVQKSGTLPTGLSFANGTISGTPTVAGSGTVVFTVTDSGTGADAQSEDFTYTFTVTAKPKKITYNNGAVEITGLTPTNYVEGTVTALASSVPAATGYEFAGWYGNSGLTGDPVTTIPAVATGDKEFWAKFTPIVYTVTYMDGSTPITDQNLTPTNYTIESAALSLPATATKAGNGFYGWYTNSACTGSQVTTIPAGSTGNKIFYAKWGAVKVNTPYVDAAGNAMPQQLCAVVTSETTALDAGWYVVNDNVTISGTITISGNVNLILMDGKTLTVTSSAAAAINVAGDNTLTIFGQSGGTGRLDATTSYILSAAIGGNSQQTVGSITINGGVVNATASSGAAIGGGYESAGGTVTINGGTVTATGNGSGAGIGGGLYGAGGTVTVNGGTLTATGGGSSAGVGGGANGTSHGTLTVGSKVVVRAGSSENPTTVLNPNGETVLTSLLTGQRYFAFETVVLAQAETELAAYTGEAFELSLVATISGGVPAYSFSGLTPDNLGLTLTSGGLLSGTLAAGVYNLALTVTDSELESINVSYTLTVTSRPKSIMYKDGETTLTGLTPTNYVEGTVTTLAHAAPAATGYAFAGWYDNAGLSGSPVTAISAVATGDQTFWASWTTVVYTVTYMMDSTTPITDQGLVPTSYTIESATQTLPATATKSGYGFYGWYTDSACTGTPVTTIPHGSTENKTFYAKWGAVKVNTPYVDAHGTAMPAQECAVMAADMTTLVTGWYVVTGELPMDGYITVSGDVTLILADGANLVVPKPSQSKAGIVVTTGNSLTIFAQSAGTGRLEANGGSISAGIGGSYSQACGTVTINGGTIVANGDSGAGIGGGYQQAGGTVTINGGNVTASGNNSGSGIGGGAGSATGIGGDVFVYGGTVTAIGGYSTAGIGGYTGADQGTLTVGENVVVKAGANENPTTVLNPNGETDLTLSLTGQKYFTFETVGPTPLVQTTSAFTAYVDEAFELALTNTVSGGTGSYSFTLKTPASLPAWLTRSGDTFSGTPASASDSCTLTFTVQDTEETSLSDDFTYTITVTPRPKTITYMDGAVELPGLVPAEYVEGTGATLPATATKTGYTFDGWYGNSGLTGDAVTAIGAEVTGNQTFWAKWTAVEYTITYMDGSTTLTGLAPTSYTIEAAETLPTPGEKENYTFAGWRDNAELTGSAVTTIPVGSTGNKTFYAKWTRNPGVPVEVTFVGANGSAQTETCTVLTTDDTELTGWYVVDGDVNYGSSGITVVGAAHIVLLNGSSLTIQKGTSDSLPGIGVAPGNSLSIYGQIGDTGTLTVRGARYAAGIGGGDNGACGTVTINGGTVEATTYDRGAGIGGGQNGAGGTVTINGGTVTATGGWNCSGIGGGYGSSSHGTLTIGEYVTVSAGSGYSSTVVKTPDGNGAITLSGENYYKAVCDRPIPVSYRDVDGVDKIASCKLVKADTTLLDGDVSAWYAVTESLNIPKTLTVTNNVKLILADGVTFGVSGTRAGIAVYEGNALTIYAQAGGSGTLNATGSAGIGGYSEYAVGSITINGGIINATGGSSAAGIGGGSFCDGGTVVINGGTVTATGGSTDAAGIGKGTYGSANGSLTVGAGMRVMAGSSENPTTVLNPNGETSITLGGERYYVVARPVLAQKGESQFAAYTGEAFEISLADTIDGGTTPYAFSGLTPDNLGLTLTSSGVLSGTLANGIYNLALTVTDAASDSIQASYTLVVSARPKAITYMDGENVLTDLMPDVYVEGVGATLPATATKTGYTFGGWYGNSGLLGDAVTAIGTEATGNQTFWAKWTAVEYTITYMDGSTTLTGLVPTNYTIEAAATLPTPSEKEGYTFAGWRDNAELTGSAVTTIPVGSTGNRTFYGKWTRNPGVPMVVTFIDANGSERTETCGVLTDEDTELGSGWYVVDGPLNYGTGGITVSGDVHLVLRDGSSMTVTGDSSNYKPGIEVLPGNSLTIYGESGGTGVLTANGASFAAGIGGGKDSACGTVTINGGRVVATGGLDAAGIGGGWKTAGGGENSGNGGTVTINGGSVTANGGNGGPGIGGGDGSSSHGTLTVGEYVTVTAGSSANPTAVKTPDVNGAITLSGERYYKAVMDRPATVSYRDTDGTVKNATCKVVTADTVVLDGSVSTWYAVTQDLTFSGGLTVSGSVNLILADGVTLTATGTYSSKVGVGVTAGNALTIYGQANGTGALVATGYTYAAGIGGGQGENCGTVTINGGVITATGDSAAGIGGGSGGNGGTVTVNGGTVTATGDTSKPGIGGSSSHGTLTVGAYMSVLAGRYVDSLTAKQPAANGSVALAGEKIYKIVSNGPVTVSYRDTDGTDKTATCKLVTADASVLDGAICSWYAVTNDLTFSSKNLIISNSVNLILVDGATLEVTNAFYTAAIEVSQGNALTIYGQSAGTGTLYATGGGNCAGIGGGRVSADCGTVTINGGVIVATATSVSGAGIGGGNDGAGGTVTINGGTVTATGAGFAAGIGGGGDGAGGIVTINGGTVTATGGDLGAGIGGGHNGAGGAVTVAGGVVTATGGSSSALGIGKGAFGNDNGTLTVAEDVTVKAGASANPETVLTRGAGGVVEGIVSQQYFVLVKSGLESLVLKDGAGALSEARTGVATVWDLADTIEGGTLPYIFSGDVPAGLTLESDGTLSGTIAAAGVYNFTLTVQDSALPNQTIEAAYTIVARAGHSVTYYDGATQLNLAPSFYLEGVGIASLPTPEKTNYVFVNWFDNAGLSGDPVTSIPSDATSDVTLYAEWREHLSGVVSMTFTGADGTEQTEDCTVIEETATELTAGWYVVGNDVTFDGKTLVVSGNVRIVLRDGKTMTVTGENRKAGITVTGEGNSLTIYGQSGNSGALYVTGGQYGAGIGGDQNTAGGAVAIYGGRVFATGGTSGSGIGSGMGIELSQGTLTVGTDMDVFSGATDSSMSQMPHGAGGAITLAEKTYYKVLPVERVMVSYCEADGTPKSALSKIVTAETTTLDGGWFAVTNDVTLSWGLAVTNDAVNLILADGVRLCSLGNGLKREAGVMVHGESALTIYGQELGTGTLCATGGTNSAGIGAGYGAACGSITINGGVIEAVGDSQAAGIGGVRSGTVGAVTINGGTVTARSRGDGAGIGGGLQGNGGVVTITGGSVTATGGSSGAGIGGGGSGGAGGTVTISGGTVVATGGYQGAGIGGGTGGSGGTVSVSGGTVTATAGSSASGIGRGYGPSSLVQGTLQVIGGLTVKAGDTDESLAEFPPDAEGMVALETRKIYKVLPLALTNVSYRDADGTDKVAGCRIVTSTGTTLANGWYAVTNDVAFSGPVTISGNVNLIIADGVSMSATGEGIYHAGIIVTNGNSLAIFGQDLGTGTLCATGGTYCAGIGGEEGTSCGAVTVNGCTVTAIGAYCGAGIGGGKHGAGGTVTVNNGAVIAACGDSMGAGIGSGNGDSVEIDGGTLTVNGGTVTATGGQYGAGVGGGNNAPGATVIVNGGTLNARGGSSASAIGGGKSGAGGTVTVNAGTVTAVAEIESGDGGAAIGGGSGGAGGTVSVNGGTVNATGSRYGAGIGGGRNGAGGTVTISGGTVVATGGMGGAGIGGAGTGNGGAVTITGGTVTATCNTYGTAGIGGGGSSENHGTLTVGERVVVTAGFDEEHATIKRAVAGVIALGDERCYYARTVEPVTVSYRTAGGVEMEVSAMPVIEADAILSNGWFVVTDDIVFGDGVTINGDVNLILADGVVMVASNSVIGAGVGVTAGSSLTIYGQELGTGILEATGSYGPGIGAAEGDCGAVTVNGGNVFATGRYGGAGIGGGRGNNGGTVTVNGGTVVATGSMNCAGIGGGSGGGNGGTVTINGGTVTATGGSNGSAGIGGGDQGDGGIVIVNGGTVVATGSNLSAGIGGGLDGSGGTVTINGGTVTATGGERGAGIGGGIGGNGGAVTITGGIVTATGGILAAGVGGSSTGWNDGSLNMGALLLARSGEESYRMKILPRDEDDPTVVLLDGSRYFSSGAARTCTIVYMDGETPMNLAPAAYAEGVGVELPGLPDVAKSGKTFGGWFDNSGFEGDPVVTLDETDACDKTLYAYWVNGESSSISQTTSDLGTFATGEGIEINLAGTVTGGWSALAFAEPDEGGMFSLVLDGSTLKGKFATPGEYVISVVVTDSLPAPRKLELEYTITITGERRDPQFTIVDGELMNVELNGNTSMTIPDTVTNIYSAAINAETRATLTQVTVPGSVKELRVAVFEDCPRLAAVTLESGVESIGSGAFEGCDALTSVTIPDTVTNIAQLAFAHCTSLESIDIPSSVRSIGAGAFLGCSSLSGMEIPQGVETIEDMTFSGCSALTEIRMPVSVTRIGRQAFYQCTGLSSVTLPGAVGDVGDSAFGYCSGLKNVVFGNGVTNVAGYAFFMCGGLTNVTIGSSLKSIGDSAFWKCQSLRTLEFPDSLESIGRNTFGECHSMTYVKIPKGVTIGEWAFSNCGLVGVNIAGEEQVQPKRSKRMMLAASGRANLLAAGPEEDPDATSLGRDAFFGCRNMESATIGSKVSEIGSGAFASCPRLTTFNLESGNANYAVDGGLLLTIDRKSVVAAVAGLVDVTVPNGVTDVMDEAFSGHATLKSVVLPDSAKAIGAGAFSNATVLATATIPSGVTTIGANAFYGTSIATVYVATGDKNRIKGLVEHAGGTVAAFSAPRASFTDGGAAVSGFSPEEFELSDSTALPMPEYTYANHTFAGWTNGVGEAVSVWHAEPFGTATFGATWTSIKTIDVPEANGIKVTTDWLEEKGLSDADDDAVAAALAETSDNGLAVWQNYVLGQDSGTLLKIEDVQSVDIKRMPIKNTMSVPKVDTGFRVQYAVDVVSASGAVITTGAKQNDSEFSIDLESIETNAFFRMTATIMTTNGTEVATVSTTNVVGVMVVTNAPATTIVGVPFKSLSDDGSISVSNLVQTANLSEGDELKAFDADGKLHSWTLTGGAWVPDYVSGSTGTEMSEDADKIKLARGRGVWLKRHDPSKPIYFVGEASDETAETGLDAATDESPKAWNIVAPPSVEPVKLNEVFTENDGSSIQVPPAREGGIPRNYTFKNGKWGYDGSENGIPKRIEADTLPPGRGFWYINKSKDPNKKISW